MADLLGYTMFRDVLFPSDGNATDEAGRLCLTRITRFRHPPEALLSDTTFTFLDFETTGTDPAMHHIVEIGAIRVKGFEVLGEFESLIDPKVDLAPYAKTMWNISRISPEMLQGQPTIESVLPDFLRFIEGTVLCAHNAEFDMAFLRRACAKSGIMLDWPCFCSLKMAKALMPALENKKLDKLAEHFGLQFEARHRAIGDIKVTNGVVERMLCGPGAHLVRWKDLEPFYTA